MSTPMHPFPPSGRLVVLTSTPSDAHTWNLVYLQLLCEELGHDVVNLGACVPTELLVGRTSAILPDAIVVSTVNGHGFAEGLVLARALRAVPATRTALLVIGGMLGVGGHDDDARRLELRLAGFDHVLGGAQDVGQLADILAPPAIEHVS